MSEEKLLSKLEKIEEHLEQQTILKKEVLNFHEASKYLGLSQSHMYKLTSTNSIPCYRPEGKKLYFNRAELDSWLQRNRSKSDMDISKEANDYVNDNKWS